MDVVKEKVSFTGDLLNEARYFFEAPKSYDPKTVKKKWKNEIPTIIAELGNSLKSLNSWSSDAIQAEFEKLAELHEKSPGSLMQPLRLSVSGMAGGPPIFDMLELIGQEEVVQRIESAQVNIQAGGEAS